jgi:hypothetical protein
MDSKGSTYPEGATEDDIAFLDWLGKNGAKFPKLRWPVYSWPGQPHDGERGVLAIEVACIF